MARLAEGRIERFGSTSSAGRGPERERAVEVEEVVARLARQASVVQRLFRCVRVLLTVEAPVGDTEPQRVPDVCEARVIRFLLEQRDRRVRQPLQLVDRRAGIADGRRTLAATTRASASAVSSPSWRARSAAASAVAIAFSGSLRDRTSARSTSRWTSSLVGPRQLERPLEQGGGGPVVAAREGSPPGSGKSPTSALGDLRIGRSELLLVSEPPSGGGSRPARPARRAPPVLVQPAREALVQLGPARLGSAS